MQLIVQISSVMNNVFAALYESLSKCPPIRGAGSLAQVPLVDKMIFRINLKKTNGKIIGQNHSQSLEMNIYSTWGGFE